MTECADLKIQPLTPARFGDLAALFEEPMLASTRIFEEDAIGGLDIGTSAWDGTQ